MKKSILTNIGRVAFIFVVGIMLGAVIIQYQDKYFVHQAVVTYPLMNTVRSHALDFTCTGLAYDSNNREWLIGDLGAKSNKDVTSPQIKIYNKDFTQMVRSIPLYKFYPRMKDIQGIAYNAADSTILFCSFDEGILRKIDGGGYLLDSLNVTQPTGVAIESKTQNVFILTMDALIKLDNSFRLRNHTKISLPGQDQLCVYDNYLYLTYGLDYGNSQYMAEIDLNTLAIKRQWQMEGSYAIEGVAAMKDTFFIANDGEYHSAHNPKNYISVYHYPF